MLSVYDMKKFMGTTSIIDFTNSSFGINSGKTTVVAVGCSRAPNPLRHFPA
jgi:hypothetical protein